MQEKQCYLLEEHLDTERQGAGREAGEELLVEPTLCISYLRGTVLITLYVLRYVKACNRVIENSIDVLGA
jgi:hypothetical protein